MTFQPGDDVLIDFEGQDRIGTVLKDEGRGWIRCEMLIDPCLDYGSGTERLSPIQTVAVHSTRVRPRNVLTSPRETP